MSFSVPIETVKRIEVVGVNDHRVSGKPGWDVMVEILSVGRLFGCRFLVGRCGDRDACRKAYANWLRQSGCGSSIHQAHLMQLLIWLGDGMRVRLVTPQSSPWVGEVFSEFLMERFQAREKYRKQATV